MNTATIHDHPIRRHLDAILTALFGGAGTVAWLGLALNLVCAVAAGISGYVTLRRFLWERADRLARGVPRPAAIDLGCPNTLDPDKLERHTL
jgi:hypothetical protein